MIATVANVILHEPTRIGTKVTIERETGLMDVVTAHLHIATVITVTLIADFMIVITELHLTAVAVTLIPVIAAVMPGDIMTKSGGWQAALLWAKSSIILVIKRTAWAIGARHQ